MRTFFLIWYFYVQFLYWSISVTVILVFFKAPMAVVLLTKLFLTVFAWFYMNETREKRKLIFYKNMGLRTWLLFGSTFILDVLLTFSFLHLIWAIF